jgi:hypothetical protein
MAARLPESTPPNGPKIRVCAPHSDLIQLASDSLVWRFGKHPRELLRVGTPESGAFNKFLELADASSERILAFAKRNGVLGLCKHGLPICHGPCRPDPGEPASLPYWQPLYCEPHASKEGILEPLESWRALARAAVAVFRLNSALEEPLRETQPAREERELKWHDAVWLSAQQYARAGHGDCEPEHQCWRFPPASLPRLRPFRHFRQTQLANVVNEWLECGGIGLRAYWRKDRSTPGLELLADARGGPNLFAYLALQLAQEWAGCKRMARCPCGRLFPAPPTASADRRNFCRECRSAGKPGTLHMAAYRRRIRQARRMKAQGATIAQIARELNSAPERIRKWIAGK